MTALNFSTGISPRNGTTSRTINFTTDGSAPFTPTNGRLLVFMVGGAVTNSNGIWTEQLQPVNSGELSVFTITASSTTSITITNNGSNYPEVWAVWEFAAGSTYVSGVSGNLTQGTNGAAQNIGTLSGLTGTKKIIAAVGNVHSSTPASTVSATWTSPMVEVFDTQAPFATGSTDGYYVACASVDGYASASITPQWTPTWSASSFANDMQYVILAINDTGGSTTPFTKDYALQWRVLNGFTKDVSLQWRVLNGFTQDVSLQWRVLNAVQSDTVLQWRVLNGVQKDVVLQWRVLNSFQQDTSVLWRVLNAIAKDTDLQWRVFNSIQKDYDLLWRVLSVFQRDYSLVWDVLSSTAFTKDYALQWRVLNGIASDVDIRWRVLNSFTKDTSLQWMVLNPLTKDVELQWRVLNSFAADNQLQWRVLNGLARDYDIQWNILAANAFQRDYDLQWRVFNAITSDYDIRWRVLNALQLDCQLQWRVLGSLSRDYQLLWRVFAAGGTQWAILVNGVETPIVLDGIWDGSQIVPVTADFI